MIHGHKHPICEYDEDRNAIIRAADFLERCLPEKCVITFFRKELEQFVQEHNLPIIEYLHSEVLDIPIYKYEMEMEIGHPTQQADRHFPILQEKCK